MMIMFVEVLIGLAQSVFENHDLAVLSLPGTFVVIKVIDV